jgi:hypothetical protein
MKRLSHGRPSEPLMYKLTVYSLSIATANIDCTIELFGPI